MRSSSPASRIPGNVNLRGKKSKLLSCKCCDVVNLKDQYWKRFLRKEMIETAYARS